MMRRRPPSPHRRQKNDSPVANNGSNGDSTISNIPDDSPIAKDMPVHLKKGITIATLLGYFHSTFGGVIRMHPESLPVESLSLVHSEAYHVKHYATFISHCWGSDGTLKYLSLMFYFNNGSMAAVFGLVALVCWVLELYLYMYYGYIVPHFGIAKDAFLGLEFVSDPWPLCISATAGFAALVFGGKLYNKDVAVFFDCACINQENQDLKRQAIKNLGSFVKNSDSLLIMWDSKYFSRLWCVYEFAVYLSLKPASSVEIIPLRLIFTLIQISVIFFAGYLVFFVAYPGLSTLGGWVAPAAVFSGFLLVCPVCMLSGFTYAREQKLMTAQLVTFDVRKAECFLAADRSQILKDIAAMFNGDLDLFNQKVQTEVKRRALSGFGFGKSPVPYKWLLVTVALPALVSEVGGSTGFFSITTNSYFKTSHTMMLFIQCFLTQPLFVVCSIKFGMGLSTVDENSSMRPWGKIAVGSVLGAFIAMIFMTYLLYMLPCALAAGGRENVPFVDELGLQYYHAPCLTLVMSIPNWIGGAYFFLQ
eukprot:TRINITY_DN15922_c0_g1_i1.p1 TRINITY_DN15922_c0_g1~~TRINITY_DN15922_c0_g1_i1.p1  ORF type:complete len:532 (+),score=52.76 TRINITY_DN15922_c0_g1_i1:29-1624(+)